MTSHPDSHPEMHRVPFRDPSLSEELSERLLSGRVAADDVPHAYRGLAALFETATSAPTAEEMAHKATVVASAVAAVGAAATLHSLAPDQLSRRRSMISKILTAKAAAAATVAALGLGTAAAAMTGALPTQANHHATVNLTTAGSGSTNNTNGQSNNNGQGSNHMPNAVTNQNAQFGLCTAFFAHYPVGTTVTSVPSDKSKVFSAFLAMHGGVSGTTTYCTPIVASHPTSATDTPDSTDTNSGTKPSDAGSSNSKAPVTTPNPGGTGTANTASGGDSSTGTGTAGGASTSGSGHAGGH